MITVVSGKIGSGKTLHLVRLIYNHLRRGGIVCTNLELNRVAMSRAMARRLSTFQFLPLSENDDPTKIPRGDFRGTGKRRVMVVLDEALNWFQSVSSAGLDSRKSAWSEWLRQSDKLGQDVFFVAQNFERAAKWIRELAAVHTDIFRVGDLALLFGIRLKYILPFSSRLYCVTSHDVRSGLHMGSNIFRYDPFYYPFYNTSQLFGFHASQSAYDRLSIWPPFRLPLWLFLPCLILIALAAFPVARIFFFGSPFPCV